MHEDIVVVCYRMLPLRQIFKFPLKVLGHDIAVIATILVHLPINVATRETKSWPRPKLIESRNT